MARAFWRLSYKTGRDYITGTDARGNDVLTKHEREKDEAFTRRQKVVKPFNYCGPLIRQFNDFVFRQPATRPTIDAGLYATLLEDIDGRGTKITPFMRRALKKSQIERECYLMPDSTAPADGLPMTRAQAAAVNARPIVRIIGADSVVWWRDLDGVMVEACALLIDEAGVQFARWYGQQTTVDISFRKKDGSNRIVVAGIDEEKPHPYGGCPLVRLRPMFDDCEADDSDASPGESQVAPMAELQQGIANKVSLHDTEIYDCTFSQWVASGVDMARVGDLKVGNNTVVCLPDPASSIVSLGADPAQAESIRVAIKDMVRELYRVAGVQSSDAIEKTGQAESGAAKAFKFNDLAANLSSLADACEQAENLVMARLFAGQGEEAPAAADYPNDFDLPDIASELEQLIRVLTVAQIPQVIKTKIGQRFASRNMNLAPEEQADLDAQLEADATETEDPFLAHARRKTGT